MGKAEFFHAAWPPISLRLPPGGLRSDENFFEFCQINRGYRIECSALGEVLIMPLTGGETGNKSAELMIDLGMWARHDGTGVVFDSSTGFILPNGATRSPEAAWVERSRLARLAPAQKKKFLPLAPDFVVELASPSDNLTGLQEKMQEYLSNGVRLGWLLVPEQKQAHLYRPDSAPVILENPATLSGEPVLPGFILDAQRMWTPAF